MMRRLLQLALLIIIVGFCGTARAQNCSTTAYGTATCYKAASVNAPGSGTSETVTFGSNTTSGHQVIVFGLACADNVAEDCSVATTSLTLTPSDGTSDSFSTLIACANITTVLNERMCAWMFTSVGATTTFKVTCNNTCDYLTVFASEWSGLAISSFVDGSGQGEATTGTPSCSLGSRSNGLDVLIGQDVGASSNTLTAGTGYSMLSQTAAGIGQEAQSVTTTSTTTVTWTSTSQIQSYQCAGVKKFVANGKVCTISLLGAGHC